MNRSILACALVCASVFVAAAAFAHADCGARVFPVPLTLDDPGVEDEASIPTITYQRSGADEGPGPIHEYDFEFEYDKRITGDFGLGVNYGWSVLRTEHAQTQTGFQNLSLTAKYQNCISPDHEFMFALGLEREFGRTGTQHTGADDYGATTPTLYFGKGLGDLPFGFLRPLAVEGEFSYSIADKGLKATQVTDPDTGLMSPQYNRGSSNQWFGGIAVVYSLQYLQSQVKDLELPPFVGALTPVVEITWSSPATSPSTLGTTWTVAPGILYTSDWYQVGVEALIPLNKAAGTNVGAIAQLHLFFDDLFPNTLGKPVVDWFR